MQVLSVPERRERHGYDAAVVLTLLVNYRKYEVSAQVCIHMLGGGVWQVLRLHVCPCVHT